MKDKQETVVMQKNSISLGTILTLLFVTLKLCKVIDWNWFWVLSPLIFSIGIAIIIFIIALILIAIYKRGE